MLASPGGAESSIIPGCFLCLGEMFFLLRLLLLLPCVPAPLSVLLRQLDGSSSSKPSVHDSSSAAPRRCFHRCRCRLSAVATCCSSSLPPSIPPSPVLKPDAVLQCKKINKGGKKKKRGEDESLAECVANLSEQRESEKVLAGRRQRGVRFFLLCGCGLAAPTAESARPSGCSVKQTFACVQRTSSTSGGGSPTRQGTPPPEEHTIGRPQALF